MSERVVVPPEMMKAAQLEAFGCDVPVMEFMQRGLEAALLWLSEHPIVPTEGQLLSISCAVSSENNWESIITAETVKTIGKEFQRRMFRAPESERPQEIPHRWSVKSEDGQTYICRGEHEKSAGCEWEPWPPKPPEPDVPEAVKDLQMVHLASVKDQADLDKHVTAIALEAYRRGLRGK